MKNRKRIAVICAVVFISIALIVFLAELSSSYKYEDIDSGAAKYAEKQGIVIDEFVISDKLFSESVCATCAVAGDKDEECTMVFYFKQNWLFKKRFEIDGILKGRIGEINAQCVVIDKEPRFFVFGVNLENGKNEAYIPGMRRMIQSYYNNYLEVSDAHSSYWHSELDW